MSVHKHKDGRWFVAYREDKKQKRIYYGRGREAEREARQYDLDRQEAQRAGFRPVAAQGVTFIATAQLYLNQRPLSANTRSAIRYTINRYVLGLFDEVPLDRLALRHLTELDAVLVAKGLSIATRNRYRSYCRAICQWAVDNGLAETNPFARYRPDVKREAKAPDLITGAELRAILFNAPDHLRWAIRCVCSLGVRPGKSELFAIRMDDVDHDRGGVWVTRKKTHSRRDLVPAPADFLEACRDIPPARRWLVEYQGRPVTTLKTTWRKTLLYSCITRRIRLYDLRHWYVTALLDRGADLQAVSALVGHTSPRMTLGVYRHLSQDKKREAVSRLPALPDPGD